MTRNTDENSTAIIADLGRRHGVSLTISGSDALALILRSEGIWDNPGPIAARNAAGDEITADDWFKAKLSGSPSYIATPQKKAAPPVTGNRTADALAKTQAARAGQAEAKAQAAADLYHRAGNPWRSSTLNRSHQALIRSGDPALADKLMAEAAL